MCPDILCNDCDWLLLDVFFFGFVSNQCWIKLKNRLIFFSIKECLVSFFSSLPLLYKKFFKKIINCWLNIPTCMMMMMFFFLNHNYHHHPNHNHYGQLNVVVVEGKQKRNKFRLHRYRYRYRWGKKLFQWSIFHFHSLLLMVVFWFSHL